MVKGCREEIDVVTTSSTGRRHLVYRVSSSHGNKCIFEKLVMFFDKYFMKDSASGNTHLINNTEHRPRLAKVGLQAPAHASRMTLSKRS
jgi:hypothetical protein